MGGDCPSNRRRCILSEECWRSSSYLMFSALSFFSLLSRVVSKLWYSQRFGLSLSSQTHCQQFFLGAVMNGKLGGGEHTTVLLSLFRWAKWCFACSISSLPKESDRTCVCLFVYDSELNVVLPFETASGSVGCWTCLKKAGFFCRPPAGKSARLLLRCDVHTALSSILLILMVCDLSSPLSYDWEVIARLFCKLFYWSKWWAQHRRLHSPEIGHTSHGWK